MRTTTSAPLSRARSDGRGSKASGSVAGGMIVSTCAKSPVTARARAAISLVVATTRRVSVDAAGDVRTQAMTAATAPRDTRRRRGVPPSLRSSPLGNEYALGQQTVDRLVASGSRRGDATVHGDAGKPIGVEPRQLSFFLQQIDHRHRCTIHGLVEIGVLDDGHVVFAVLGGGQRRSVARR